MEDGQWGKIVPYYMVAKDGRAMHLKKGNYTPQEIYWQVKNATSDNAEELLWTESV